MLFGMVARGCLLPLCAPLFLSPGVVFLSHVFTARGRDSVTVPIPSLLYPAPVGPVIGAPNADQTTTNTVPESFVSLPWMTQER